MELKDKVVLISGATGGIGKQIALLLSQEGCKLAIFARREKKLQEIVNEINNKTECIYKKCDVTNKKDVAKAVKFTNDKFNRIDLAVLTAGILVPNPIETFNSDIIKNSMEINFFGNVYFLEYVLPIMKAQKAGSIAVTSTLPDKRGVPGWGAYGASKAAISWLMESLRAEAKQKYNISITIIKPGSVETPMIDGYPRKGALQPEKAAKLIVKGIRKEKKIIQFPLSQVLSVKISNLLPVFAYDCFPIHLQKGEGYPIVKEKDT